MTITQIEKNVQILVSKFSQETFIYDLLLAYGTPKASISRLQNGNLNLSKVPGVVNWKKKVLFKEVFGQDLHQALTDLKSQAVNDQRFVIVTDYTVLFAWDTKTADTLQMEILDLPKHLDFFLPWAGMEKAQYALENPADVKAAEKMARLYDEIRKDNPDTTPEFVHGLNVFLSRLLFCFFAEDTNIFKDKQFTGAISSHTQADGSDLNAYLDRLFEVLNTSNAERSDLPNYLSDFPYVNGGLFRHKHPSPIFTRRSRQVIIDSGELDWSAINPDIFGSMIQAVVSPEHRGGLGMHYTSVPNIMKVIEPLFLNELYEAFEVAKGNPKKLNELLFRLGKIKIFDPACGSANFLIIAYKELRKLEIAIIRHLQDLQRMAAGFSPKSEQMSFIPKSQLTLAASFQVELFSRIHLSQFYGIEIDDFAHEIAQLSLWLAEHQMNVEFFNEFGQTSPTLPLKESGNVVHGNACRIDWEKICPKSSDSETFILGNPPYLGSRRQDDSQKADLKIIFGEDYKSLDYIAAWFYKGAAYIEKINSKCAFVSTNSICQGEQVSLVWKRILQNEIEIGFAHKDFKWSNNAKRNAAVIVIIVGLQNKNHGRKYIFNSGVKANVNSINPYLVEGATIYIETKQSPLSAIPEMNFGNMPADGGKLLFTIEEKNEFISKEPKSEVYFKKLISAFEFLNGRERHCLWLEDCDKKEIESMPLVKKLVSELKQIRKESSRPQLAKIPHLFAQITQPKDKDFIIIPRHSSENRDYIPIGFFNGDHKAHDSCLIVPTTELFIFAFLTSRIHMCWVQSVAGRIKTDFRYSKDVVYNNFPFPIISLNQKKQLETNVYHVLEERERHSEKTLSQLYDPDKMPDGLRKAHSQLDFAVERCYRIKPFESDEERLEYLFKLYEKMIAEEQTRGSLFEKEKKQPKKKKS